MSGTPASTVEPRVVTLRRLVLVIAIAVGVIPPSGPATASAGPTPRPRPELPATASQREANNSPALAADPTEPRFMALANRLDAPDFSCALQLSGDGGRGWVPRDAVPRDRLPKGVDKCYAPEIAFDGHGRLYYLFAGLHGLGNTPAGIFLTTSSDRGRTFSAARKVLGPNAFQARMLIDTTMGERGRVHLVWLAARGSPGVGSLPPPPNPILAAHSDDGGRTFSRPVQVSDPERLRVVAPAVALGTDHRLHVLYYDLGGDAVDYQGLEGSTWDGVWTLVLATSNNQATRFGRGVVVDDEIVPPGRVMLIFTMPPPALATDGSGAVYAAWRDARAGDPDVWLRRSANGGRKWGGARRLNDDAAANGRDQDLPRLSVAPNGRLDAIFLDRRDDPDNRRNHVYYTSSADAGRTFAANIKVTSRPSDAMIGQRYAVLPSAKGLVEFGSRNALVSWDDRVVAAWTDTRYSTAPMQQDVMATIVDLPSTGSEKALAARYVAAMAALAALAVVACVRRRPRPRPPQDGKPVFPQIAGSVQSDRTDEPVGRSSRRRRPRRAIAVATGAALVVTAGAAALVSGSSPAERQRPLPPPPTVVALQMNEYRFNHRSEVRSSRVVFRVANEGRAEHDLALVRLPDDLPGTLDAQLHSGRRRPLPTIRLLPRLRPGGRAAFAVDLSKGRYGLVCAVPGPDGESHALKGMNSELRVR